MTDTSDTTETMCRFCLCSDDLIPFSEAITTAFDFEDVVHYTGVEMAKDENVVVCEECCISINNSKNYRLTCIRNDSFFKLLVCYDECTAKTNITVTRDAPNDAERKIQETTAIGSSENDTRLLENSISDDSSPLSGQPVANETNDTDPGNVIEPAGTENDTPNANEQNETETTNTLLHDEVMQEPSNDESSQASLDDEGSQEFLNDEGSKESFDDEAIEESLNTELIKETNKERSIKQSTENNEDGQTTEHTWIYRNRETSTNWSKRKRPDANDSDDSVTSLYTEWVEKTASAFVPMEYGHSPPILIEKDVRFRSIIPNNTHVDLCSYCGLKTKYLKDHVQRTHCKEKKFECPICQKKFPGTFKLNAHINSKHERRIMYTCEQCGKGFVCRSSYDYHMTNSHGKSDVYECETCQRKLRSWDGYKKHLKEHSLTALKCQDCGRLYKNRVTLEKHKVRYHSS